MIILIIILSIILFFILLMIILGIIGYNFIYKRTKKPYCVLDVEDDKFRFPLKVKEKYIEFINYPHEEIYIKNNRNIKLYGELRKSKNPQNNKPIVILFSHGHLSNGKCDVPLFYNFQLNNYDLLSIDHEGNGNSEGKHSGFGIYEYENILLWVNKINEIYNHNVDIYLHGVSMGSNSILLTVDKKMENVKGLIADCGYTSTYDIVKHLTKFHFAAFSVCLFNSLILKRNVFKYSTLKTLKNSLYPILFIHGDNDKFVPTFMSLKNEKVCSSKHKIILFKNAGHARSYFEDPVLYEQEFNDFIKENSNI